MRPWRATPSVRITRSDCHKDLIDRALSIAVKNNGVYRNIVAYCQEHVKLRKSPDFPLAFLFLSCHNQKGRVIPIPPDTRAQLTQPSYRGPQRSEACFNPSRPSLVLLCPKLTCTSTSTPLRGLITNNQGVTSGATVLSLTLLFAPLGTA